jgi:hypothetical protein
MGVMGASNMGSIMEILELNDLWIFNVFFFNYSSINKCFTDHTLAHPLNWGGVVARFSSINDSKWILSQYKNHLVP